MTFQSDPPETPLDADKVEVKKEWKSVRIEEVRDDGWYLVTVEPFDEGEQRAVKPGWLYPRPGPVEL